MRSPCLCWRLWPATLQWAGMRLLWLTACRRVLHRGAPKLPMSTLPRTSQRPSWLCTPLRATAKPRGPRYRTFVSDLRLHEPVQPYEPFDSGASNQDISITRSNIVKRRFICKIMLLQDRTGQASITCMTVSTRACPSCACMWHRELRDTCRRSNYQRVTGIAPGASDSGCSSCACCQQSWLPASHGRCWRGSGTMCRRSSDW